jgi:predicted enzyme related to lactoylglutathione lyase
MMMTLHSPSATESAPTTHARALVGAGLFSMRPDRLVAFYTELLGLRFEHRNHEDGREHWVTQVGDLHFEIKAALTAGGEPTPDAGGLVSPGRSRLELSFQVGDVDDALARALELGASPQAAVRSYAWGRFAVVLDPDGNRLGIYAPGDGEVTA